MSSSRTIAWMIWLIASIFYAYQYILRVMPNIMMSELIAQFHIDAAIFGQFTGIYYIGYTLMHLPIGIMIDRYGPKKVMPICMLLTVVGALPIIFAEFWLYPIIGRALVGIGSAAAILGVFKIIRLTFSEQRFTRMLSFSVTIGLIGAIYGGGPVNYMCLTLGYKTVVGIFASMGVVLSIVTYILVPNVKSQNTTSIISDIKAVFANTKVMAVCLLAGLMVGPLEGFADVWGTEFLKQVYGFENGIAASLPSIIFVGMCFGAPVLSLLAEKTKSHLGVISTAGAIMAICFTFIISGILNNISIMMATFVIIGICCAYQIIAIYKASTYVKENVVGLTTAVANMIIMAFGYMFHSVIGQVTAAFGGVQSASAFTYGLTIIPAALIIGALGFAIISIQERARNTTIHKPANAVSYN